MGKTQYYCAASLDGFIAESDDTLNWLTKYEGSFDGEGAEPMKGSYDRFYEGVGALVMGSATYQFVLDEVSKWPYEGKPTWVLIQFSPDWRWMLDREDSPWYPTMRLFRQTRVSDWSEVIERVVNALGDFK